MKNKLFIDVETFSSVDIASSGAYKYVESPDFEILIIGYAINSGPIRVLDLAQGEKMPEEFEDALLDEGCLKVAHNAVFERLCFRRIGYDIPADQWYCTSVKAAYCGLPLSLDNVSKALDLQNKKLDTGKALIRYFSCPCKPTIINGKRTRNYPQGAPEKWKMYKEYNYYDVASEREIFERLQAYEIPEIERKLYVLDQEINDRGILVDIELAKAAIDTDIIYSEELMKQAKELTGLENPNSIMQVRNWIYDKTGQDIPSLSKADMPNLLRLFDDYPQVTEMLEIRKKLSKTSIKKYYAMINCAMADNRVRGTFQFYGASRTGRWAGRLLQLQNLSKNHTPNIEIPRELIRKRDIDTVELLYDDVADILSQLVRTALVAPEGKTLAVADFSAIEARVISWLANEQWRMDVFRGDGKIYEATGSKMFNVPISAITKGSELRQKSKISELALGYEGSVGALMRMGGEVMGLSSPEMISLVRKWRDANPAIVKLWKTLNDAAMETVRYHRPVTCTCRNLVFDCDGENMTIQLPSGRKLFYRHPRIKNKCIGKSTMGTPSVYYEGVIQATKQWGEIDTYGGKLTENCLASGTKVITNNGIKPIEEVLITDLIWDGEAFVKHEGLIDKGLQAVISINGIKITPDHKILTTKGWRKAYEAEGLDWANVPLPYYYLSGKKEIRLSAWRGIMRVWDLMNCGPRHRFCVLDSDNRPRLVHNCIQAIARDLLGYSMLSLNEAGYTGIIASIHDEVLVEVDKQTAQADYDNIVKIMSQPPAWASDLPLRADGYITPFYLKD